MPKDVQAPVFTPRTLIELVRYRAGERPEAVVYTFLVDGEEEEQQLTYAALDQRARAVAAGLQSLGAAGERVLLLYPPGLDYIVAFLGCLYAGERYVTLLEGIAAGPECPVSALPLLTVGEEQQLLVELNDTEAGFPREASLADLVMEQAESTPEAPAVICGEESLTYASSGGGPEVWRATSPEWGGLSCRASGCPSSPSITASEPGPTPGMASSSSRIARSRSTSER